MKTLCSFKAALTWGVHHTIIKYYSVSWVVTVITNMSLENRRNGYSERAYVLPTKCYYNGTFKTTKDLVDTFIQKKRKVECLRNSGTPASYSRRDFGFAIT